MNEGIFGAEYAPPIKAKRKKYKVGQGSTQQWGEAIVLDTGDNEGGQSLRQQGTTTSNDVTDFIIKVPVVTKNNTIVEGGSLMLSVPDGTVIGGNKRGANSIDLQTYRTAATQVASGINSTVVGNQNTASGLITTSIGYSNNVTGDRSVGVGVSNIVSGVSSATIGYNNQSNGGNSTVTIGYNNFASGTVSIAIGNTTHTNSKQQSIAMGYYSRAENYGDNVVCIDLLNTHPNIAKYVNNGYYKVTSNNTPIEATLYGQANQRYVIQPTSCVNFTLTGSAIDSSNNAKAWTITGCIKRNGANGTSIVGTVNKTVIAGDTSTTAWDITVTADDTNEALSVFVTGDTTLATRFAIKLETTEVKF